MKTGRDEVLHRTLIHREAFAASAISISADLKAGTRRVVDAWSLRSSGREREVSVLCYAANVLVYTALCGGPHSRLFPAPRLATGFLSVEYLRASTYRSLCVATSPKLYVQTHNMKGHAARIPTDGCI
ncbi:hypothetical protein MRX96_027268 [Rhipicephalus microplus]